MGRITQRTRPDSGTWRYTYDALGHLKTQTNAKNQQTVLAYDKLGRLTTRTEPSLNTSWTWDACPQGIGKLCAVNAGNSYSRQHSYDAYGRPGSVRTTLDSDYVIGTQYDAAGRLQTQTWPNGVALRHHYAGNGQLSSIWAGVPGKSSPQLIWQLDGSASLDAQGRIRRERLGNGSLSEIGYDDAGNNQLLSLQARRAGASSADLVDETVSYDHAERPSSIVDLDLAHSPGLISHDSEDRLKQSHGQSLTYSPNGNLSQKPGVGTYSYSHPSHPHAVSSVTGTVNGSTAPSFAYDANGQLTSGAGRTITWMSFPQPDQISAHGHTVSFLYDDAHQRVKETDVGPTGTTTTFTINPRLDLGHGFRRVITGTTTTDTVEVSVAGRALASIAVSNGQGSLTWRHLDKQGSVVAVTNEAGSLIQQTRYDAWGLPTVVIAGSDRRGYTGHEHLHSVGLINMNGRLYDPELARFLSPDPYIQDPGNFQNYNSYSYVVNSPWVFTDPSGELTVFGVKITARMVLAVAAAWYLGPGAYSYTGIASGGAVTTGMLGNAYASAFAAGFAAGGIQGGTLRSGFQGGASALLFMGAGEAANGAGFGADSLGRAAFHGIAGCASAAIGGGQCGNGFISAGLTEYASSNITFGEGEVAGLVKTAVIGGTVSELTGGQFANGAVTGAFQYLMNAGMAAAAQSTCVASDCWSQGAMGAAKAVGGGLTAATGAAICTSLAGCALGGPMAAFGASDAWQGGGMVVDAVQGISSEGFNLIKAGFQTAMPDWGGTAYEGISLGMNVTAIGAKVPLIVGASDGINRVKSIFDVTVSRWDNARVVLGNVLSQSTNRLMLTGSAIGKFITFGKEFSAAGSGP
jgi:RHS repeat-associated protein